MCYAKPGPRCGGHAKESFRTAAKAYSEDPNDYSKFEAFQRAKQDLYATPAGWEILEREIDRTPKSSFIQRAKLKKELKSGQERRQAMLNAYYADQATKEYAGSPQTAYDRIAAVARDPELREELKAQMQGRRHLAGVPDYKVREIIDAAETREQMEGIVERLNSGDEFPIDGRRSSEGDPLMAYQSDNDLQNLYSTTDYAHHLAMSFAMDDPKRYKVASITSNGEHVHWVAHDQFTHELVDVYGRHSSVDDLTSGWEMFDEMRENGETIDMKRYDDPNDAQKLMTAGHEFFPPFWRDNADVVKERFNLSDSTKRLTAYQKEAQNASS